MGNIVLTLISLRLKVIRGEAITYFNEIFDALCKLSADTDMKVANAAHLLDRLVKVILVVCLQLI